MASLNSAFSTLLFIVIFAGILTKFSVGSHNLHNYKKSSSFHKACLEKYGGIWMGQELWLQEKHLSLMSDMGVQYVARSGMESAVSSGMLIGRPHGGVSIAWSADLNHVMRPLLNYKHKRLVCVEMIAEPKPIIFVSLYMPFYDSGNRTECISETVNVIAMLEEIMADHPLHSFVIGGDFNTEFTGNSPFDKFWEECRVKSDLICCDSLTSSSDNSNNKYTYFHQSLNQRKWNDHFLVTSSLVDLSSKHLILDDGDNVSDHLPIMMCLSCNLSTSPPTEQPQPKCSTLKWEKCSEAHKQAYNSRLRHLLNDSPSLLPSCSSVHCTNEYCRAAIQSEYDNLIKQISDADKALPRHKPGVQKPWWTEELTNLRQKSIDIHRLWQSEGKPRSGPTNTERLKVKAAYQKAIKSAQRSPRQLCWNRLHGA